MRDQVLSIDQMKHLKDLDIDTSEATLYWTRHCHGCKIDDDFTGEWFLSLQKEFQVIGFISYEVIPTFTLQDLLIKKKTGWINIYHVDGEDTVSGIKCIYTTEKDARTNAIISEAVDTIQIEWYE